MARVYRSVDKQKLHDKGDCGGTMQCSICHVEFMKRPTYEQLKADRDSWREKAQRYKAELAKTPGVVPG